MAGGSVQDPTIGVGAALRRARRIRGLTLEEAARDLKLRVGLLRALEDENFEALPGDVYVRGSLRSYSGYLGLNADKVVGAYAKDADEPEPPPPPAGIGRVERALASARIRDNQKFLLVTAATIVIVLLVFGLLSRQHAAPPAAVIATETLSAGLTGQEVDVVMVALRPVHATVVVDGESSTFRMREGETQAFSGTSEIEVDVADGTAVRVTVDGTDLGVPGVEGEPWHDAFRPDAGGEPSPIA